MPNANTFAQAAGAGTGAAQGASSTAEFQFVDNASTPVRLRLRLPPGSVGNGRPFKVLAGGRFVSGTAGNLTINLDHGDSATIGSNTTIETTGAIAMATDSGSWRIEAELQVDSVGDRLLGYGYGEVNGVIVAEAATAIVASVDPAAEIAFTVTGQCSASHASNAIRCDYFEAQAL